MNNTLTRTLTFLLIPLIAAGGLTVYGRRPAAIGAAPACSGGWSGVVTYTKRLTRSNNKTVERVSGRGSDTTDWQMQYDYAADVTVTEAPDGSGLSLGRASISHSFSSTEKNTARERNSCDMGRTWREMSGILTSESRISGSSQEEADVSVGVDEDGRYSIGLGLPSIQGTLTGAQSSSFSGQCTPKEGRNDSLPPTPTTIDGASFTTDGSHRVDPARPDRLSGSYTRTDFGVTETLTWSLRRCAPALRLLDLRFEEMKFPNWNDWKPIDEETGTVDGNLVRIKAKVLNASGAERFADVVFKETYQGDAWNGARPDAELEEAAVSVRLAPGEEKEVEFVWDSSGYAWFDDGRPRRIQRIRAELSENGKKTDDLARPLRIAPKPLVLVHGLWSDWRAWETWQNILTTAHSYGWKAFPVGEKPAKGVMNTGGEFLSSSPTNSIFENSQQLGRYIRYAQEERNAWHVDLVAHSMGGLISRHYIHQFMPPPPPDGRPQVARLIMLGTPNMGSPCADVMNFAFEMTGSNVEAVRQLKPSVVEEFNRVNVNRKGVRFAVLAGDPLPVMCQTYEWNDGVVAVPSAIWKIRDHARSKNVHTELTGTADFSAFVLPRLAIGPKGDHGPEAPELPVYPERSDRRTADPLMVKAFFAPVGGPGLRQDDAEAFRPDFARAVRIPSRQSVEIELPVAAAPNFGLTFMAAGNISATLFDERGTVAGRNTAGSPEAAGWFRSIYVDRSVTAGTWRLRLENASDAELEAVVATWRVVVGR